MRRRLPPPTTEQQLAALDALRGLGFFPSRGARSAAALLQTIQAEHGEDWLYLCANLTSPAALEQLLVWQDRERVWSRDLEGVYPGEEACAVTLAELAAISRGGFAPSAVSETWASPEGPVLVRYTADAGELPSVRRGAARRIPVAALRDWVARQTTPSSVS
jgi:hypothetical protein